MTKVVNIYKEDYDVYIGRKGKDKDGYFGNPFSLKKGEKRGSTLEKYKVYFYNRLQTDSEFKQRILNLRGKRLGCFCKPNVCHGDIIKEYLDNMSGMSILDLKFPWFQKGIETVVPSGEISLRQFIEAVRNPKDKIRQAFIDIQTAAEKGDIKLKDKLKQENLFFTTPSVRLKYRNYASIEEFLPFAVLEYDKIQYAEELRDYIFEKFKSCIFAFTSPSKTGCKFIFLLEKCPESVEEYKEYYYGIAYNLDKFQGLDLSNQNPTLPLFNSWDPNAKLREDAVGGNLRGYRVDSFKPPEVSVEPKGGYTEQERKDCISLVENLINRVEDNGHPQVVKAATICGGLSSYYGLGELWDVLQEAVINNYYLSKNTNGYLKTALEMYTKGGYFATPLNKN